VLLAEPGVAALPAAARHRVALLRLEREREQALRVVVGAANQVLVDAVVDEADEAELLQPVASGLDEAIALLAAAVGVVGEIEVRNASLRHAAGSIRGPGPQPNLAAPPNSLPQYRQWLSLLWNRLRPAGPPGRDGQREPPAELREAAHRRQRGQPLKNRNFKPGNRRAG
jgi:hypothetical protein